MRGSYCRCKVHNVRYGLDRPIPKGIGLFFFRNSEYIRGERIFAFVKGDYRAVLQQNKGVRLCLLTQVLMAVFLRD